MVGVVGVAGCASSREQDVADAATRFHEALSRQDGQAACDVLAPATLSELEKSAGKPCPQAILEEQLPAPSDDGDVSVFDTAGQVRYSSETTFLGEFSDGWRVLAAGCTPKRPGPYDCVLTGG